MKYCLLFIYFIISSAEAASFDCNKASTPVEKTICANPELSKLDESLSIEYKKALETNDNGPLILDQKNWLKNERAACKDATCLQQAHRKRINTLQQWNTYTNVPDNIDGNYVLIRNNVIFNGKDWDPIKTTDCLLLKRGKDNEVEFRFNLIQTNAHLCTMSGIATAEADQLKYFSDSADGENECQLSIKFKSNTIELIDIGNQCRQLYCGARGAISGNQFLRSSKTNDTCKEL